MRKYGSGPAGPESIGFGHTSVRRPERILENVGDHNRFSTVHGRAACSCLRANGKAVYDLGVGLRKAGSGAVSRALPVLVEKQDRAKQAGKLGFHNTHQIFQYFLQWTIARYHLQNMALPVTQRLSLLAFGHVHQGTDDLSDFSRLIHHRVRDGVKMLYPSVRKNNSEIKLRILLHCGLHFRFLQDCCSIVRVDPVEDVRPCGPHFFRVTTKDAKGLLRPEASAGMQIPSPTSTLGQPLRLSEITLAPP